jgi:hypothetical protein
MSFTLLGNDGLFCTSCFSPFFSPSFSHGKSKLKFITRNRFNVSVIGSRLVLTIGLLGRVFSLYYLYMTVLVLPCLKLKTEISLAFTFVHFLVSYFGF